MNHKAPSFFALRGLRPSLFGESYVLISVSTPTETLWAAEYHILTSAPNESLRSDVVSFDITGYPTELPPMDERYMVEEALLQADRAVSIELHNRTTVLGNAEVDPPQFTLELTAISPVSLWTRGIFEKALEDIAKSTRDSELKRYLELVMGFKGKRKP
jgi:hypothetical protein